MEQLHINVTSDGIRALESLSDTLNNLCTQMLLSLRQLHSVFEDNSHGLGVHTAELETLLDELDDLADKAGKDNQKLAKKAARAAKIRRSMVEESPYRKTETVTDDQYLPQMMGQVYDNLVRHQIRPQKLGPSKEEGITLGGKSPYVKTTYSESVSYTDPKTKQRITRLSTRDVYENTDIDPAAVIPAGIKFSNGHTVKEDTTNLELMKAGKAPFIWVTASSGSKSLVPVELHHLSGEETCHSSTYFTETERDGSLVEIAATTHDDYSHQLHIGGASFRRDAEGNKTEDAAKYEQFRSAYWKHRAQKYLQAD